ncbi:MAG: hypothetical protein DI551_05610 [Micavibrio aeruginosavorus]|uniref:Uncharacterized protein n=1 Tax=Micavibrio aeruginosavorus TaxID=349221 RepID=A0A2W5N5X6_9BACT|nr:MAG: hypothetical protein DI551_05610 [Micavibrio aeruginosavorus]
MTQPDPHAADKAEALQALKGLQLTDRLLNDLGSIVKDSLAHEKIIDAMIPLSKMALSAETPQPCEGVDRVTADDFWPINSTEKGSEPITRPRIDWWWLCKKIEFQRRELKQLNEWLSVYRKKAETPTPQLPQSEAVEAFEWLCVNFIHPHDRPIIADGYVGIVRAALTRQQAKEGV